MCNLYRLRGATSEIAGLFGVVAAQGANFAEEIYPGYTALVIAAGAVRPMTWGFPLALTSKRGQKLKPKPVNNAREDKLQSAFWRDSFTNRRCLIPVSEWAEAEGPKGHMTRTWHYLPDRRPFLVAGVWRPTTEWGDAFSMVMVDGCSQMSEIHDRMPLVLDPQDWRKWTGGAPEDALGVCQTYAGELVVERTDEPWAIHRATAGEPQGRLNL